MREGTITIGEFGKVNIQVGHIIDATPVEGSNKLLKLTVDFGLKLAPSSTDLSKERGLGLKPAIGSSDGSVERDGSGERDIRTVVSGIALYFESANDVKGKKCAFVTNLEPRMLMGIESQAMILAARDAERFTLLEVPQEIAPGAAVG